MSIEGPWVNQVEASTIAQQTTRSVLNDAEEKENIENTDKMLVLDRETQSLKFVRASDILEKADQALDGLANKVDKTTTVSGKPLTGNITLTKADVELGNVQNVAPVDMPVSTAQQTAINQVVTGTVAVSPTGSPVSNINAYKPLSAGTYANFGGVVVIAQDLLDGDVQILRDTAGAWSKKIVPVLGLVNYQLKADSKDKGTFDSIALALEGVTLASRKLGDTVSIKENGSVVEYWWKSSTTDLGLINKTDAKTESVKNLEAGLSKDIFASKGANLNIGTLHSGYIDNLGVIRPNSDYLYSDPVDIKGQESIIYAPSDGRPSGANTYTAFYTSADIFVSAVLNATNGQVIPVPIEAVYARTTVWSTATSVELLAGNDVDKISSEINKIPVIENNIKAHTSEVLSPTIYTSSNGVVVGDYVDLYNAKYVEGDYAGRIVNGVSIIPKAEGVFEIICGTNVLLGDYVKTVLATRTITAGEVNKVISIDFIEPIVLGIKQAIGVLSINSTSAVGKSATDYGNGFYFRQNNGTVKQTLSDLAYRYIYGGIINNLNKRIDDIEGGSGSLRGKTIYCVGDSITFGATSSNPYPTLLNNISAIATNYGVSGTEMGGTDADTFHARMLSIAPGSNYLIVMGGTNDFLHNIPLGLPADTTVNTFYGAVDLICKMMLSKFATSKCAFMTPIKIADNAFGEVSGGVNSIGNKLIDYVNIIKTKANFYGIPVLDLNSNCGINPNIAENKTLYFASDGCHPLSAGDLKMFPQIRSFIEGL